MNDFYGPGDQFATLSNNQANESITGGYISAQLADPFANERKEYQNSLRTLMTNPGDFSSSPFYKFAYDQGLNALQRKGSVRSGNKLAQLMQYGQGMASQQFFPMAGLLSTLSGATTGSPAAAGLAVQSGLNRAQDLRQQGLAQRNYGNMMNELRNSLNPPKDPFDTPYFRGNSGGGGGYSGGGYMPAPTTGYRPSPTTVGYGSGYDFSGGASGGGVTGGGGYGVGDYGMPSSGASGSWDYGTDYGGGWMSDPTSGGWGPFYENSGYQDAGYDYTPVYEDFGGGAGGGEISW